MTGTVDVAAVEKDAAAETGQGGTAGGAKKFAAKAFVEESTEVEVAAVERAEKDAGVALTREQKHATEK